MYFWDKLTVVLLFTGFQKRCSFTNKLEKKNSPFFPLEVLKHQERFTCNYTNYDYYTYKVVQRSCLLINY